MIINSNWKDITLAGQLVTYFKLNNAEVLILNKSLEVKYLLLFILSHIEVSIQLDH
jgi:hypothetical protein